MLKYSYGSWQLCSYLIKYTQHGEKHQAYDVETKWWEEFVRLWDHTKIEDIESVEYTDEQIARFNQIRYMPEDFGHIYSEYVRSGKLIDTEHLSATHPFQSVILSDKVSVIENGIITESIETSNGIYSKFSNGVLICQHEVELDEVKQIAFPHGFVTKPVVTIESVENKTIDYTATVNGLILNGDYGHKLHYVAIGRWK